MNVKINIIKIDKSYAKFLTKEEKRDLVKDNAYCQIMFYSFKNIDFENERGTAKGEKLLANSKYAEFLSQDFNFCKNTILDYLFSNTPIPGKITSAEDLIEMLINNQSKYEEYYELFPSILKTTFNYCSDKLTAPLRSIHVCWGKPYFIANYYKSLIMQSPIREKFFKLFDEFIYMFDNNDSKYLEVMSETYGKILTNKTIMEKCDHDMIYNFLTDVNNRNKLLEIVETAFGIQSRKILESRPQITISEIPNFYIFEPKIVDSLGTGTIHNVLSYDTCCGYVIGAMARDESMLQRYMNFSVAVKDLFSDESIDMDVKMRAFYEFDSSFHNVDVATLNEHQQKNLLIYLFDRFISFGRTNANIYIDTFDELNSYESDRNKKLDEAFNLSKAFDFDSNFEAKSILYLKYFGYIYQDENKRVNFSKRTLDMKYIMHVYHIEDILTKESMANYFDFNESELKALYAIIEIKNASTREEIEKINKKLAEDSNLISLIDFKKLINKIDEYYCKKMTESLTTYEDLEQMAATGKGITKSELNGVTVYTLDGADFKILAHYPFFNQSELKIPGHNPEPDKMWGTFEHGCSTISCCLIEPALSDIFINSKFSFGFYNINYRQIAGMAPQDAHVAHEKRLCNPDFDENVISYNLPEELGRQTAEMILSNNDPNHKYNEVALYRRTIDSSQVEAESDGGRLYPDYIICYSKNISDEAIRYAKEFGKNNKPLPIIVINTEEYNKKFSKTERAKKRSETINENQNFILSNGNIVENPDLNQDDAVNILR